MRLSHAAGATALLLLAIVSGATANFFGEGTYYGDNGWAGACQGNVPWDGAWGGSKQWPPSRGGYGLNVALNSAQYSTSQCGRRLKFRGTGKGLGHDPPPQQWQEATVTNLCPECKYGDIDFGKSGDGRWEIEWYWVDENPNSGGNQVESTGSKARAIPKSKPAPKPAPRKAAPKPQPATKSYAQRKAERAAYLKRKAAKLAKLYAKRRAERTAYLKRKAAKIAKIVAQRKAERAAYLKRKAAKLAKLKQQRGRRLL